MTDLFDDVFELPDPDRQERLAQLVGLDAIKERLLKEGQLLVHPASLDAWSQKFHGIVLPAIQALHKRPPLIMFAGDVGTGKTTLAECFGDAIARQAKIPITVMRMSLRTRGTGAVGEMTRLIGSAFANVADAARKGTRRHGKKPGKAIIFIIDEADALAQSRETEQMHHEDRAGVNALIRGIDDLGAGRLPVIVVMCTNRLSAIDPAILRRARFCERFCRPTKAQSIRVLQEHLASALSLSEIDTLADQTGATGVRDYGFTYSDLCQRLIPAILLDAYPDRKITLESALATVADMLPTRPFVETSVSDNRS